MTARFIGVTDKLTVVEPSTTFSQIETGKESTGPSWHLSTGALAWGEEITNILAQ